MRRAAFSSDDRAAVIPVGFLLVLTVVVMGFTMFQLVAIPDLSKDAEIDAHRDIESDFIRMDSSLYRAATTKVPQPVVMGNRIKYPPHLRPYQTPTPQFYTHGPFNLSIDGGEYTANDTSFATSRDTRFVRFSRDYNFFTTARAFGYEHGIFYTQPQDEPTAGDGILVRDEQTLINNRTLTIIAVQGDVAFSRPAPTEISITPIVRKEHHADVTNFENNTTSENITLTLPTRLTEQQWVELLEDERTTNGGHVQSISYSTTDPRTGANTTANYITVALEPNVTYEMNIYAIRMERV